MGMQQAGRPGKAAQAVGPVDSPRQGKILGCDVKEVTKSYVNEQRVSGAGSTPINIVEIKQKERKMPEVAKKDRSKRRAVNSDSGAKSKSPLSGRKRVQTERSCSTNNAASKRQTGVKDISSPPTQGSWVRTLRMKMTMRSLC
jgi:hypothetical protein